MERSPSHSWSRRLSALLLAVLGLPACGPSADDPLPPRTDLYKYSLAVATKAKLKVPKTRARPLYNIGRVHQRFGLEDIAIEWYQKALELDGNFAPSYREIGFLLSQRQDRMAEAVDAYTQALRTSPNPAGLYTRIALIYIHLNRVPEAIQSLQQEIRAETADVETYYNLGVAHSQQENWKDAIQAYERCLELDPQLRRAHYGLATCRRAVGDMAGGDAAWKEFERLRDLEDEVTAEQEVTKGNEDSQTRFACETWLDAADVFVEESILNRQEGGNRDAQRRLQKEARDAILQAIDVNPKDSAPYQRLLSFQLSVGNLNGASQAAERWMRSFPKEAAIAHACAQSMLDYAQRNMQQRGAVEPVALDYLDRALLLDPNLVPANFQWSSLALTSFGDRPGILPQAMTRAALAVKNNPHPRAYDILAWACHRNGQFERAKAVLQQGMKAFPKDTVLRQRYESFTKRNPK